MRRIRHEPPAGRGEQARVDGGLSLGRVIHRAGEKPVHSGGDVRPAFDGLLPIKASRQALDLLWRVYRNSRNNPDDTRNRVPNTRLAWVYPCGTVSGRGHATGQEEHDEDDEGSEVRDTKRLSLT